MNYYDFTLKLINEGADLLLKKYHTDFKVRIKNDDPRNFVSEVDLEVNKFLISKIEEAYPDHAVYSEEGGGTEGKKYLWALDPIDGTSNFIRRIPHFALSITLLEDGVPIVGAVLNPITNELYSFEKGKGAFLDGDKVTVSDVRELKDAWVPYRTGGKPQYWKWGVEIYYALLENCNKSGSFGSLGLDICFVGAGKIDGLIYGRASLLDNAVAIGFLKEAGGVYSDFDGNTPEFSKHPQPVIFANSQEILDKLVEVLPHPKEFGIE